MVKHTQTIRRHTQTIQWQFLSTWERFLCSDVESELSIFCTWKWWTICFWIWMSPSFHFLNCVISNTWCIIIIFYILYFIFYILLFSLFYLLLLLLLLLYFNFAFVKVLKFIWHAVNLVPNVSCDIRMLFAQKYNHQLGRALCLSTVASIQKLSSFHLIMF